VVEYSTCNQESQVLNPGEAKTIKIYLCFQYYKDLRVRMNLVYVEFWNTGDKMAVSPQVRQTMQNFINFKAKELRDVDHHSTHLIT
jgi:hypothetical protein